MIIITEKKKALPEYTPQQFHVNYFGVDVTYKIKSTPTGNVYYDSDDAHKAAKVLAAKAKEMFLKAQAKAGIKPTGVGGWTAEAFIPTCSALD